MLFIKNVVCGFLTPHPLGSSSLLQKRGAFFLFVFKLLGVLLLLLFRQRGAGAQRLRSSIVFINNVICGCFNSSPRQGAPLYYKKEERYLAQ